MGSKFKAPVFEPMMHWVTVKVHTRLGGELIQLLRWDGMRFETRTKWDWYFKYRAALAQVQHPRAHVEMRWGNEPAIGRTLDQLNAAKARSKKAKITELRNKLQKAVDTWESIFPIEQDSLYQKALAKIERLESELCDLQPTPL